MPSVQFVVGNTYTRIPRSQQQYDRSGRNLKEHDWTLYIDVVQGDPDCIQSVCFNLPTFQPNKFVCSSPVSIKYSNGTKAWRFSTRQQSYASIQTIVQIRGAGGSVLTKQHRIVLSESNAKHAVQTFHENRPTRPLRQVPLPRTQKFGIELELTATPMSTPDAIADDLGAYVAGSYSEGREPFDSWKLVPDSSIVCNVREPNCHKFELVSPVLEGGGLDQIYTITEALKRQSLQVNKSMGFHVHVDVSGLSVAQLVKVCQNFIKYEEVMDTFMPPSRRTGSPESDSYFQSCVASITPEGGTNKQRHQALALCRDCHALARLMNRHGRYYKLNLQNLVSGRQPTLEFRQHSATTSYHKIAAWVRFCVALVRNSARLATPSPFREDRSVEEKFDALFMYVIKDRALQEFYKERQVELRTEAEQCCADCAAGGTCAQRKRPVYQVGGLRISYS